MLIEEVGELQLIKKISQWVGFKDKRVIIPIGDDAAVVKSNPKTYLILTTDALVEDVHFRLDTISPYQLGYKALAVAISDVAAMAGVPHFALISLGLKSKTKVEFVKKMYQGMLEVAREYALSIVGGESSESKILTVNVAAVGEVEPEFLRTRGEAQVGEKILVTGDLGASAAYLELLLNPKLKGSCWEESLKKAHFFPEIRVKQARIAASLGAKAMEDISDGLANEIFHLTSASKVGAKIFVQNIPMAPGVSEVASQCGKDLLELGLYGGEDYELVFTTPPQKVGQIKEQIFKKTGTTVTEVGEIVDLKEGLNLVYLDARKIPLKPLGYEHFK